MVEEQEVLPDTYIKFISPVVDLNDKRNDQSWKDGYISITTQRVIFTPEVNNEIAKDQAVTINISEIYDIDKRIDLWKKVLGAAKILPIHHILNGNETASLISTSAENYGIVKKILLILIMNETEVDYVCPFSQGGKIFLDKKPVNGKLYIDEDKMMLVSEWLGKQQTETIDIKKLNDFDRSDDNSAGRNISSITVKYQKDGIVTSTLVTGQNRVIRCLEKYIKVIKGISEDEEEIELNEQQFMLLQMMYTSDIDAEMAMGMLEVDMDGLENIVHELVQLKVVKSISDDEVELTELGTKYIVGQMKKNIGG